MLRLDRYILRQTTGPALLGLFLYLAVLLVNSFFKLAELAVQHGVALRDIGRLLLYLLPNLLTMTAPMAVLLGVLVGLSALSSRSEIVAMKACGVSTFRMLLPVVLLGLLGTGLSGWLYHRWVPDANQAYLDLRVEIARSADFRGAIRPRVFHEGLPGMVLYADDLAPDGRTLRNVFLYREPHFPARPHTEVYVAREASVEGTGKGPFRIELRDGSQHRYVDPAAYEMFSFERYRIQEDPPPESEVEAAVEEKRRSSRGPRQMDLPRLRKALAGVANLPEKLRERRERTYLVEIHKRFALPLAALVFAVVAFPLGASIRRGGRASGFAISLGVILAYWVMISWGEDLAIQGGMEPWLGVWLPNAVFLLVGGLLYVATGDGARLPGVRGLLGWVRGGVRVFWRVVAPLVRRLEPVVRRIIGIVSPGRRKVQRRGARMSLMDRYVLTTYLQTFLFLFGSLYLVYVVGDYFLAKAKHVHENEIGLGTVLDYYRFLTPQVVQYVLPLSAMVAALVAFGLLGSSNEIRAMICSGLSVYRVIVPVVLAALALSILSYWLHDYVLPYSNRRAEDLEDTIEGRSPRSHYRPDRRWVFGESGRLYHYTRLDERRGRFLRLEVFDLDERFRLERRTMAPVASWQGPGWELRKGWTRSFSEEGQHYESFDQRVFPWSEPPEYFSAERKPPEEMSFAEYASYIEELEGSGYETKGMRAELWHKLAFPSVTFILVLVGLPFAFRMQKQGSLYGVGLALGLGMIYYTLMAIFTALGRAELLPPLLAAFAPNVIFGVAALYLLLTVRT